jgi:hypothetical protein
MNVNLGSPFDELREKNRDLIEKNRNILYLIDAK